MLTRLTSDPQYFISSDEEEPLDPEEIKRELEREKIRELKKRKINSALTIGGRRVPMTSGVFIRRDQDESADVDVTMDAEVVEAMEVDQPPAPVHVLAPVVPKHVRGLRKTETATPVKPKKEPKRKPPKEESKPKRGPKSDTYKQTWSVEEQHLLEQLLEEIPDGEKNRRVFCPAYLSHAHGRFRWAKISQAMNGRRTPRQVASRVQKYFEKLKKFGVDVDE